MIRFVSSAFSVTSVVNPVGAAHRRFLTPPGAKEGDTR